MSKRGAKQTTGRFETRQELVESVTSLFYATIMNQAQVARYCRVSASTVANILNDDASPKVL